MPIIDVALLRQGEPAPWPAVDPARIIPLADPDTIHVAAIEAGMTSGAPSLAIRFVLVDGREAIAETSLAAWIAATCAFRGAFPDAFTGTPLAEHP